jgi:two-component system response regulator FixJ
MPGANGVELTRLLRERGSTMPVILLTGNANGTLKAEAMSAGADAVLEKPAALGAILAEISRVTADWV